MSAETPPTEEVLTTPTTFPWTTTSELALLQSLLAHKPAGINKHFSMALVAELLASQLGKDITSEAIWAKLRTMYDLAAVDDREEVIPFPLEEKEFSLPRRDYGVLVGEKQKEILKDRTLGKNYKGVLARMSTDMGSEHSRKEKVEVSKGVKGNEQKNSEKSDADTPKPTAKRTRSTPSITPAKKRK